MGCHRRTLSGAFPHTEQAKRSMPHFVPLVCDLSDCLRMISLSIYIYIYIYIEGERETYIHKYVHIMYICMCVCIYIYIYIISCVVPHDILRRYRALISSVLFGTSLLLAFCRVLLSSALLVMIRHEMRDR